MKGFTLIIFGTFLCAMVNRILLVKKTFAISFETILLSKIVYIDHDGCTDNE